MGRTGFQYSTKGGRKLGIKRGYIVPFKNNMPVKSKSIGRYKRGARTGVPNRINLKLRYFEQGSNVAAGVNVQVWNASSLYDPNTTGAGQQPQGFDEMASLFYRYRVNGCKIRITYINTDTDTVNVVTVPSSGTSAYSTMQDASSAPMAKSTFLNGKGGTLDRVTHKMYVNPQKWEGWLNKNVDLQSLVTASPSSAMYIHQYMAQADATNVGIDWQVEIIYYVTFFDPKPLAIS